MYCSNCGSELRGTEHYCPVNGKTYTKQQDSGDFVLSALVGAVTDNALLGVVLGGSLTGAILGDLFGDGDIF